MPNRDHLEMVEPHDCEDFSAETLATRAEPYQYTESGLGDWYLIGIRYWTCSRCGKKYADIPAIKGLHRLMAREIVCQQSPLRGDEMRFLRKRLGKTSTELAAILGVELETYSRFENNKRPPTRTYDRLVRLYYALNSDDSELRELARTAMNEAIKMGETLRRPPKKAATMVGNEWQSVPEAA
jgi:putative zinc finger/helix-turn-helix YgiT family protein